MQAFDECMDLVDKLERENKLLKSKCSRSTVVDNDSAIFVSDKEASVSYVSAFSSVGDRVEEVKEKEVLLSTKDFLRKEMKKRRF